MRPEAPVPIELSLRVRAGPQAPAAARHALAGLQDYFGTEDVETLELLVTELVTNGYRHGGRAPESSIIVDVSARTGVVRVEVSNDGGTFEPHIDADGSDESGWGLFLLDRLSTRWGMRSNPTCVWFEIQRGSGSNSRAS